MIDFNELFRHVVSTDDTRPNLLAPSGFTMNGERWVGATNGHIAACVRGECVDVPKFPNLALVVTMGDRVTFSREVTLAKLRAWAGPLPVPPPESPPLPDCKRCKNTRKCGECDGEGMTECCECEQERTCEDCDGSGRCACSPKPPPRDFDAEIAAKKARTSKVALDTFVDRELLTRLLSSAPDTGIVTLTAHGHEGVITLEHPDWRGAIMPMNVTKGAGRALFAGKP
jgi:hypothetical protein